MKNINIGICKNCAYYQEECMHKSTPFHLIKFKIILCEHWLHKNELYNVDKSVDINGNMVRINNGKERIMDKKQRITSIIKSLELFYDKCWSPNKVDKIVDMISHSSSSYIEKAVERILKTESELGTNPVPQIREKITDYNVEIDPVTYDYE